MHANYLWTIYADQSGEHIAGGDGGCNNILFVIIRFKSFVYTKSRVTVRYVHFWKGSTFASNIVVLCKYCIYPICKSLWGDRECVLYIGLSKSFIAISGQLLCIGKKEHYAQCHSTCFFPIQLKCKTIPKTLTKRDVGTAVRCRDGIVQTRQGMQRLHK